MNTLREAEVLRSKGAQVAQAYKQLGVTDQTYYKWRREYCGPKMDKAMLQEVASGNL